MKLASQIEWEESEMPNILQILHQSGRRALALGLAAVLSSWAVPIQGRNAGAAETVKNLNVALNGERNAHLRYLEFAQKADEEGYGAVGSLFRAAATAEATHGNNHEKAIRKLGGIPEVTMGTPVVRSTQENLETAIAGESHESKTMYPDFAQQARQDRAVPAIVTFEQAMRAEEEHAKLFENALRDLDRFKGAGPRIYYVCTACGYVTTDLDFEKCVNCLQPKDRYQPVS